MNCVLNSLGDCIILTQLLMVWWLFLYLWMFNFSRLLCCLEKCLDKTNNKHPSLQSHVVIFCWICCFNSWKQSNMHHLCLTYGLCDERSLYGGCMCCWHVNIIFFSIDKQLHTYCLSHGGFWANSKLDLNGVQGSWSFQRTTCFTFTSSKLHFDLKN